MKAIFGFAAIRLFFFTLLLTIADLLVVAYLHDNYNKEQHDLSLRAILVENTCNHIIQIDEELTQTIRMYALHGEETWKSRYNEYYAQIDTIFLKARTLTYKEDLSIYNQLFVINEEIGGIEKEIIKAVQKAQFVEAQSILEGKVYAQAKQKYFRIAQEFIKHLRLQQEELVHLHFQKERWLTISLLVPIPILLVVWVYVLRFIQRHLETEKKLQLNVEQQEMAYRLTTNEMRMQNENIRKQTEQMDSILKTNNKKLHETSQQLRQAYAKLAESEKMAGIGLMTASISHEIKNPVNFIYGGIESLKDYFKSILAILKKYQEADKDNLEAALDEIKVYSIEHRLNEMIDDLPEIINDISVGAERISEIITGLNNFARQDSELKMCDIHQGIDTTLVILKGKIKEKSVEIHKNFDANLPLIECFSGKTNQIFMNLIANAVQAIDRKGTVTITTRRYDTDFIQISVRDTGKGMDRSTQKRIFEPFFTTKSAGEGTGLGLSIVNQIIEQHKGSIDLDSEEGKGTEFVITLPILQKL